MRTSQNARLMCTISAVLACAGSLAAQAGQNATLPLPPNAPPRLYVRVEAADLAGNVGTAQTPEAVLLDTSRPRVEIRNVEPGKAANE